MAKVPGLVCQGTKYHYRRVVPAKLRDVFPQGEIWIALGTSDFHRACRLAREAAVVTDREFAAARAGSSLSGAIGSAMRSTVTSADLQRVAKQYFWKKEKSENGRTAGSAEFAEDALTEHLDRLMSEPKLEPDPNILASVHQSAVAAAEEAFPEIVPGGLGAGERVSAGATEPAKECWQQFVELIRRADLEHIRRSLDRLRGDHGDHAYDPLFQDVTSLSAPIRGKSSDRTTIGELISRFETDPRRAGLTESAGNKVHPDVSGA